MIVLVKKSNITLIILIFLLSIAVYSLNLGAEKATPASSVSTLGTVIIDAGHGGEDPGKVSGYSGVNEKELNLSIAKLLADQLEDAGYRVIMTREEDKLVYKEGTNDITDKRKQDLTRRKEMMDNGGADIAVSIHMNDFSQSKYYGAQVFYPPDSEKSKLLAVNVQMALRQDVDPSNLREALLKSTPIVILRNLKTPTIIVECGFLSNQQEEQKLRSENYQLRVARAIKSGIDNYYNAAVKESQDNINATEPNGIIGDGIHD
ncbi:MAG: N-acetylmuramoyl-L-alanine amidase [Thermoclostridium sp.]|nr:N-acetylmuramoyl-L-alanine amidase [Thermoclostridium sp.]